MLESGVQVDEVLLGVGEQHLNSNIRAYKEALPLCVNGAASDFKL